MDYRIVSKLFHVAYMIWPLSTSWALEFMALKHPTLMFMFHWQSMYALAAIYYSLKKQETYMIPFL